MSEITSLTSVPEKNSGDIKQKGDVLKMQLSSRLVITMVIIQAIMLATLVWNSGRIIKDTHIEQLERTNATELEHMLETVSIGLIYADRAMLAESLSHMESRDDFSYAIIYDRKKRIMASSGDVPEAPSQVESNTSYANSVGIGIQHLSSDISKHGQFLGSLQVGFKTDHVRELMLSSQKQNIIIAIIIFLLTLMASILLGRYISSNLRLLERGARHFSRGDLNYRIAHINDNTINDVANAFNTLAENLQSTINDVNERNSSLVESEFQVRLLLDSTAEAIFGLDMDGCCTFANPACVQMLGYRDVEELIGQNMHKLIHNRRGDGTPIPANECLILNVLQSGKGNHEDSEVLWQADGNSFPAEFWSYPIYHDGNITGAVVTFLDITERLAMAAAQRESDERYKTLVDSSPDWVWETNSKGIYTYASSKVYDLLGYLPEEVIGKTPFELMSSAEAERIGTIFTEIVANKSPIANLENTNCHKNGHSVVLETSGVPILSEDGELLGYRGIDRDVTQRKIDEREFRAQQYFTNTVLDAAGNVIVVLDLNGCLVRFNRAAEELTGYTSDEVLGKPVWDLVIPEEQQNGVKSVFAKLSVGEEEIAGQYENEWVNRHGGRRLLHWHNSVLRDDDDGVISHIVALGYDITEKKVAEAEHARIQNELQQAQKMESLGQLTGGIAHDFNNLLGIINGYAGLALEKYINKGEEQLVDYVRNIKEAGERAADLVTQMLVFSRSDQADNIPIQFAPLLREDIKMLRATLPSTIEIEIEIEPDLPSILMNPTQLHQILMNLSINARDAMNGEGQLTIRLGWTRALDTDSPISHKPITGDWIELCVGDTGSGIDPEIIQDIFNPFFTTKEVGKGTGMGLSVIYRIMEDHGGHILLESEQDKGTTFCMLFPPILEEISILSEAEKEKECAEVPEGNGSEILVVDDEPMLALHMSELVKGHGYEALCVSDSTEALKLFEQDPERFSMLITDQTMPKMTGSELIVKLRDIRPDLPVVMCSGFSDKVDGKEASKLNIPYFEKPVNVNKLLLKIAELLSVN